MRGRWLAVGGAVAVTGLALGIVFFVVLARTGESSRPEQPLPTPPPDPSITDTGIRRHIHREFSAPTSAPNDIVCEADATVLIGPDGRVTGIEKAGRQVTIHAGEPVDMRGMSLANLPQVGWPVQRINGTLVLGWRSCETLDGEPVPITGQ